MIRRLLQWFASMLQVREIRGEDGSLYLSRYKLLGWMPGDNRVWPFSVYLHHFHRPDMDEAPHNHPWKWACSFILIGGYWEYRITHGDECGRSRWKGPLAFNWISHSIYHLVTQTRFRDTWTIFMVGPRVSSWGFLVPGRGHVEWREQFRERGIPVPGVTYEEI